MFFPEFLYQLSGRDQQVTWLDPVVDQRSQSTAAASVSVSYTVPEGRILVLTNVGMDAVPGAAQNVAVRQLYLVDPGENTQYRINRLDLALAAGLIGNLYESVELLVPPEWKVVASADFNAGAVANQVLLHLMGISIPIGNIARL